MFRSTGPSGAVLINQGARFAGCMKFIEGVRSLSSLSSVLLRFSSLAFSRLIYSI